MKLAQAVILAVLLLLPLSTVFAEDTINVTATYEIKDDKAVSGDIIANRKGQGFVRDDVAYDSSIFGILQENPLLVFRKINSPDNQKPIVRQGDVVVNVNSINGDISSGDYVTSSPIAGQGMKANQSGYVVGIATGEMNKTGTITYQGKQYPSGTVQVSMRVEYAELNTARSTNRLLEQVNSAFFTNVKDPEKFTVVVRYLIAGVVSLVFLMISFFGFTRSLAKSVEAIGRNPLAKSSIQFSMLIHLGLAILAGIIGLIIAFIVILV